MIVIMECENSSSEEEEICVKKRNIVEIYESCKSVTVSNGGEKQGRRRTIYEHIVCKKYGEGYGEERLLLLCDGCGNGYRMYCVCPILVRITKGKWFCPSCSKKDGIRDCKKRCPVEFGFERNVGALHAADEDSTRGLLLLDLG
ncbi:hypothetical protein KI387_031674, partial [Taxus chinensis]